MSVICFSECHKDKKKVEENPVSTCQPPVFVGTYTGNVWGGPETYIDTFVVTCPVDSNRNIIRITHMPDAGRYRSDRFTYDFTTTAQYDPNNKCNFRRISGYPSLVMKNDTGFTCLMENSFNHQYFRTNVDAKKLK